MIMKLLLDRTLERNSPEPEKIHMWKFLGESIWPSVVSERWIIAQNHWKWWGLSISRDIDPAWNKIMVYFPFPYWLCSTIDSYCMGSKISPTINFPHHTYFDKLLSLISSHVFTTTANTFCLFYNENLSVFETYHWNLENC